MTERRGRWAPLPTESVHPSSRRLEARSTQEIVSLLLAEDERGLRAARRQAAAVAKAADLLAATLARRRRVLLAGAGTSGRLGVLEAAECPPTFGTDPRTIRAAIAGGRGAVFRAVEGAEDDAAAGRRQASALRAGDLLIGISASAATPFVRGALAAARQRQAGTILVTCAPAASPSLADLVIAIPTGPEILAGSTRLKAGSATKAVLNAITTAAMVRLGKTSGPYMVDLRTGSAKLRDRARRIVAAVTGQPPAAAARLLRAAGGDVKAAIQSAGRQKNLRTKPIPPGSRRGTLLGHQRRQRRKKNG